MRLFICILLLFAGLSLPVQGEEPDQGVRLNRWGITVEDGDEQREKPAELEREPGQKNEASARDEEADHTASETGPTAPGHEPMIEDAPGVVPESPEPSGNPAGGTVPQALNTLPEDRPWIIHQAPVAQETTPAPLGPPVEYMDEAQERLCSSHLEQLEDSYSKARYSSVSGDACSTTKLANEFLDLIEKCRSDCPANLLLANGYDAEFVRNMRRLKELGQVRCLQGGK